MTAGRCFRATIERTSPVGATTCSEKMRKHVAVLMSRLGARQPVNMSNGGSMRRKRIVVLEHSGHAFATQLSRELANRSYEVLHLYNAGFSGPRGRLEHTIGDPSNLRFEGVGSGAKMDKYSVLKRPFQELLFGVRLGVRLTRFRPTIVLIGNTPPLAVAASRVVTMFRGFPYVFWVQDLYAPALTSFLVDRFGPLGRIPARCIAEIEASVGRGAKHTVVISDHFIPEVEGWGVERSKITVIPNWAMLSAGHQSIELSEKWRVKNSLPPGPLVIYAGTLGLKHNPRILGELAARLSGLAHVVVASEGLGADVLTEEFPIDQPRVIPFQPHEDLGDMLAAASVLVALLEPSAGRYSVPSKILSYLNAGRPILAALPLDNPAAEMINQTRSGCVVEPGDLEALVAAACELLSGQSSSDFGRNGREFAEKEFNICTIADRFEMVFESSLDK